MIKSNIIHKAKRTSLDTIISLFLLPLTVVSKSSNLNGFKMICTDSEKCKFPFEFKDKTYTDCTKDGGYDTPWCYTEDSWGYCKPCKKILE